MARSGLLVYASIDFIDGYDVEQVIELHTKHVDENNLVLQVGGHGTKDGKNANTDPSLGVGLFQHQDLESVVCSRGKIAIRILAPDIPLRLPSDDYKFHICITGCYGVK